MRRNVLVKSVRALLPHDVEVLDVVYMWRRSGMMYVWASAAAAIVVAVMLATGYGTTSTRVAIAVAVALVVAVITTDARVLAQVNGAPEQFVAGRVRQVAVRRLGALPATAVLEAAGSNLVMTEWLVGVDRYSVPRSFQAAMVRLAEAR